MNGGFALIAVLWLIAGLAALIAVGGAALPLSRPKVENRLARLRGQWAARGCAEIFRARFALDTAFVAADSISLGPDIWCSARRSGRSGKLGLNHATDRELSVLLADDSLAAAILDWQDRDDEPRELGAERTWYLTNGRPPPSNTPVRDLSELLQVRGVSPGALEALDEILQPRTDGRVDPNVASVQVLTALEEMPAGGAEAIGTARAQGKHFRQERDISDVLRASGLVLGIAELGRLTSRFKFVQQPEAIEVTGTVVTGRGLRSAELLIPVVVQGARVVFLSEELR